MQNQPNTLGKYRDLALKAQWINDKHQETNLEAIVGLARRKDKRVNDVIMKELSEGEYGIALLEAVVETGEKSFCLF